MVLLSMYFDYAASQHYIRTITQGVTLADSPKKIVDYRRLSKENIKVSDIYYKTLGVIRNICSLVSAGSITLKFRTVYAKITDTLAPLGFIADRIKTVPRFIADVCNSKDAALTLRGIVRAISDTVRVTRFFDWLRCRVRVISDTLRITDKRSKTGSYIRILDVKAHNATRITRTGIFHRFFTDNVALPDDPVRSVGFFRRIFTLLHARDYIISRFLVSQDAVKLKSRITKEIVLKSSIR
jgi:hypothetical protein